MKLSNPVKRLLVGLVIFIPVSAILLISLNLSLKKSKKQDKTPYEYNIDIYKKTPEKLLLYKETGQIKIEIGKPKSMALDSRGNIHAAAGSHILIFNNKGDLLDEFKTDATAGCIAVHKNGDIFLGIDGHVEVYNKEYKRISKWESIGEKAVLTSIAVKDNDVFIADYGHRVVWHYSLSGKLLHRIDRKDKSKKLYGFVIPSPYFDAAVDKQGMLWIANPGMAKVENFTYSGEVVSSWGSPAMTPEGFAGCCNPSQIAIGKDGKFITAEKGALVRVKVYDARGRFKGFVAGTEAFDTGTEIKDVGVDNSGRVFVLDPKRSEVRIFMEK